MSLDEVTDNSCSTYQTCTSNDKRYRYPSSTTNVIDGAHDVDSSTELWDEDDAPHCSYCSSTMNSDYAISLKSKIRDQQSTLTQLKDSIKELEVACLQQRELKEAVDEQSGTITDKCKEIERLETTIEELDQIIESDKGLKALLKMKDQEIGLLNREINKLSTRVSDYNEIEAHNTDLQSELFARDREVMSLKHSQERLKQTYLELVKNNSGLENKLLQQDGKHEEEKRKFENSIVKLTNKLITLRKKCENLEQENAKSVRDCRLAVRLLQCTSPSSNEHNMHHSNKLTFLFDGANMKPISNKESAAARNNKKDLKMVRQNSFEEEQSETGSVKSQENLQGNDTESDNLRKTHSSSCLESLHCMSRQPTRPVPIIIRQTNRHSGGRGSPNSDCNDCAKGETVLVLKDLLQGKKDAIRVLRVELGRRDKEIGLLRRKMTQNINHSINTKNMDPKDRIQNLESRVSYLTDENFNLKYQLEMCRKMLDRISDSGLNSPIS